MLAFMRAGGLLASVCLLLAACDDELTDAAQLQPGVLDLCAFEATIPSEVTFEDIGGYFAVNRQFCSWVSFSERRLIGTTFLTKRDTRKPSEILNGVPDAGVQVCNVQPMIDAGWKLKALKLDTPQEYSEVCGRYGVSMSQGAVDALGRHILDLPQHCFRLAEWGRYTVDRWKLASLGSTLSMRWTLPVRFDSFSDETGVLRLWFDDAIGAAWSDDWPGRVISVARADGIELIHQPCENGFVPSPVTPRL